MNEFCHDLRENLTLAKAPDVTAGLSNNHPLPPTELWRLAILQSVPIINTIHRMLVLVTSIVDDVDK